ncbi:hypothetical protein KI387_027907, partial [Taxus chinensis]
VLMEGGGRRRIWRNMCVEEVQGVEGTAPVQGGRQGGSVERAEGAIQGCVGQCGGRRGKGDKFGGGREAVAQDGWAQVVGWAGTARGWRE